MLEKYKTVESSKIKENKSQNLPHVKVARPLMN